jgi:hypothetical protein
VQEPLFWPAAIGCRAQARMIPLPRHALPTPRPAAFGPRRHGFPRSHGPAEDEVNGTWLTLRYCPDPRSSRVTRITSGPRCNERGENAEGTRDAQESWRVRSSRWGRRTWRDGFSRRRRRKETLAPADPGRPTMYLCGPIVYNHPHIGNAGPAVVFDMLARVESRRFILPNAGVATAGGSRGILRGLGDRPVQPSRNVRATWSRRDFVR